MEQDDFSYSANLIHIRARLYREEQAAKGVENARQGEEYGAAAALQLLGELGFRYGLTAGQLATLLRPYKL